MKDICTVINIFENEEEEIRQKLITEKISQIISFEYNNAVHKTNNE